MSYKQLLLFFQLVVIAGISSAEALSYLKFMALLQKQTGQKNIIFLC